MYILSVHFNVILVLYIYYLSYSIAVLFILTCMFHHFGKYSYEDLHTKDHGHNLDH